MKIEQTSSSNVIVYYEEQFSGEIILGVGHREFGTGCKHAVDNVCCLSCEFSVSIDYNI